MPADPRSLLRLEVPVIVQLASRTMMLEEVLALAPGSIVELPKKADEDLEIIVNNKAIGVGRALKVGENFGLRVTAIGDLGRCMGALESRETPSVEEPRETPPLPEPRPVDEER